MTDIPELSGPNMKANKDPSQVSVHVQPIKSDKNVVGEVVLGTIDQVDLSSEQFNEEIDTGVAAALKFKPIVLKSPAIVSAVTQLRSDVLTGAPAYLNARNTMSRSLIPLLVRQDHSIRTAAERRAAITSMILERTLNSRFKDISQKQSAQLETTQNILQFQTTVGTTYMRQALALNYRQLYATNNLLTLTKAFADMVENKLEAIKINTKLPDAAKPIGIFRRLKDSVVKNAFDQAGKVIVGKAKDIVTDKVIPTVADYLNSNKRPDLHIVDRISGVANRAADMVQKTKLGHALTEGVKTTANSFGDRFSRRASALNTAMRSTGSGTKILNVVDTVDNSVRNIADRIKGRFDRPDDLSQPGNSLHPDVLWSKSSSQRGMLANWIPTHKTETITPTEGSRVPPPITRKDINDLVTKHLEKIYKLLDERMAAPIRENSFTDHNDKEQDELGHPVEGAVRKAGRSFGLPFGLFGKKGGPGSPSSGGGSLRSSDRSPSGTPGHPDKPEAPESTLGWLWRNAVEGAAWGAGEIGLKKATAIPAAAILAYKNRSTIALKLRGMKTVGGLALDGLKFRNGMTAATDTTIGSADLVKMAEDVIRGGEINVAKATKLASKNPKAAEFIAGRLGFKSADEMIARGVKEAGAQGLHIAKKEGVKATEAGVKTASIGTRAADWLTRFNNASKTTAGVGARVAEKVAGTEGVKAAESVGAKVAEKEGVKVAEKVGIKEAAKIGATTVLKGGAKFLVKKAPVLAAGAGLYFGAQRALQGDWWGAALEVGSGLAGATGGGIPLSIMLDGYLAERDVFGRNSEDRTNAIIGNRGIFIKARIIAYGANKSQISGILDLEFATNEVILHHKSSITAEELQDIAAKFGFDIKNKTALHYFHQWVVTRFSVAYCGFYEVLRTHKYTRDSEESIPDAEVTKILDEYNKIGSMISAKYKGLAPTPEAFLASQKALGDNANKTPAMAPLNGVMLARSLSNMMGLGNNVTSVETKNGVPVKINGVAVPVNLYTPEQLARLKAAQAAPGAPPANTTGTSPQAAVTAPANSHIPGSTNTSSTIPSGSALAGVALTSVALTGLVSNGSPSNNNNSSSTNTRSSVSYPTFSSITPQSYNQVPPPSMDSAPRAYNDNTPAPVSPIGGHYTAMPSANPYAHTATIAELHYDSKMNAPGSPPAAGNDNRSSPSAIMGGADFNKKAPGIMQNLMTDFALTKEQAAGIVGNIGHECGGFKEMQEYKPLGGGRGGLGWAQWTGPRRVQYEKYCNDNKLSPNDDKANYGFLKQELQTTYKSTIAAVKQTNSPDAAMKAFEKHYEAAGVKNYASRQNYTDNALNSFDKSGGPSSQTAPSGGSETSPAITGGAQTTPAGAPGSPGAMNASFKQPMPGGETAAGVGGLPKGVVGQGECVDLVKSATGLGQTGSWKQGASVVGNPNIKPGTAIATFDGKGNYDGHNSAGKSHTAIYLGPSTKFPGGIRVYDQWDGQPAHERDLRPDNKSYVDNANSFHVVNTAGNGEGVIAKAFQGSGGDTAVASAAPGSPANTTANAPITLASATAPGSPVPKSLSEAGNITAIDTSSPASPDNTMLASGMTQSQSDFLGIKTPDTTTNTSGSPTLGSLPTSPTVSGSPTLSSMSATAPNVTSSQQSITPPPSTNASVSVGPGNTSVAPTSETTSAAPMNVASNNAGPTQSVVAPMRNAMVSAQASQHQSLVASAQTPKPIPLPAVPTTHPELLANSKSTADLMKAMLSVSGNIHKTLEGLHKTTKDAYGDKGVFAEMNANQLKTQPQPIIAPTINQAPQPDKNNGSDDGLDVSKKREPRYAA
jgi:hypothetical protein